MLFVHILQGGVDKDSVDRDFIKAYVGFNLINFKDENVIKLKNNCNWELGMWRIWRRF